MLSTRNIIIAFIASPGDVSEERRIARKVVDDLNTSIKTINWQVDLLGWEDTLPGANRPQELINEDLDLCELFIGVLWKKWGTPTGKYSSGFEEEFERARIRRIESQSPEMWLAFKKVDADSVNDPGEHLKRVLTFKEQQIELREVLFKEFTDTDDWKTQLSSWLLQYVLKKHNYSQKNNLVENTSKPTTLSEIPSASISEQQSNGQNTAFSQLNKIAAVLCDVSDADSLIKKQENGEFSLFDASRLQLFGTAITSAKNTGELLDVHIANYLYKEKEQVVLIPSEMRLMLRTLVGNQHENISGWYWFKHVKLSDMQFVLLSLAAEDVNTTVKERCLNLLKVSQIKSISAESRALIYQSLNDESATIRISALKILGDVGKQSDIQEIEKLFNDSSYKVKKEAKYAKLKILLRANKTVVLNELLTTDSEIEIDLQSLDIYVQPLANKISEDNLFNAIKNPKADIRLFATRELLHRKILNKEHLESLITDSDADVQKLAYIELIKHIDKAEAINLLAKFTVKDDYISYSYSENYESIEPRIIKAGLYGKFSYEELFSKLEFSIEAAVILRAMAKYYPDESLDLVRNFLNDEFDSLRQTTYQTLVRKYTEEIARSVTEDDYEFIRNYITAGSLGILADYGKQSDVEVARKYIDRTENYVRFEAIRIFQRFAQNSDINLLIDAAKGESGSVRIAAVNSILRLYPGINKYTLELLKIENDKIKVSVLKSLTHDKSDSVKEFLKSLLNDESDSTRKISLILLANVSSRNELKSFLDDYISNPKYYYNVVCWLDRILYAPGNLNAKFKKELELLLQN